MRKESFGALVLLFTAAAAPVHGAETAAPPAEQQGPVGRVKVQKEIVDVGDVVRGQGATATFILENTGTGPLHVLGVKPGCGCTVASFDEEIAPGKSGTVVATVKTENFSGPITKGVRVTTDDPEKLAFELQVKANVVGSIQFLPTARLALPSGGNWDFATKVLVRKDASEKGELRVSSVATSAPWLQASARKVEREEPPGADLPQALPGDYVLEVRVGEDAPEGHSRQTVTFDTGLSREPKGSIPVGVSLRDPILVRPRTLQLRSPEAGGQEVSGVVSAIVRPGRAGQPLKASATPDAFRVTVVPDGERRYTATVSWKPGEAAPKEGSVVLEVGPDKVTVPVRVIAAAPAGAAPAGSAR